MRSSIDLSQPYFAQKRSSMGAVEQEATPDEKVAASNANTATKNDWLLDEDIKKVLEQEAEARKTPIKEVEIKPQYTPSQKLELIHGFFQKEKPSNFGNTRNKLSARKTVNNILPDIKKSTTIMQALRSVKKGTLKQLKGK